LWLVNIIENIWLKLKNAFQRNIDAITSVDKLKTAITTAWMNVPNTGCITGSHAIYEQL